MSFKVPEKLLADRLQSDPAVAGIIAGRVYPVIAPASAAIPFVVWRRQSVRREQTLSGPLGMPSVTLAMDMYAETYEAVRALADACRACLDGWGGQVGNYTYVRLVSLVNEADGFIQLAGGDLPPVYSVTQTYQILWGPEN
jgi:hypothetical protein